MTYMVNRLFIALIKVSAQYMVSRRCDHNTGRPKSGGLRNKTPDFRAGFSLSGEKGNIQGTFKPRVCRAANRLAPGTVSGSVVPLNRGSICHGT